MNASRLTAAFLSLLFPGLGQLTQGRMLAGFGTIALEIAVLALGYREIIPSPAMLPLLAIISLGSIIDAYRHPESVA